MVYYTVSRHVSTDVQSYRKALSIKLSGSSHVEVVALLTRMEEYKSLYNKVF